MSRRFVARRTRDEIGEQAVDRRWRLEKALLVEDRDEEEEKDVKFVWG